MEEKLADWLRALMQNPIYDDETLEEAEYRLLLFAKIPSAMERRFARAPLSRNYEEDDIPF
jgi:hypothetical protein